MLFRLGQKGASEHSDLHGGRGKFISMTTVAVQPFLAFAQFPLDADGDYHATGLSRGEDLFNAKDLAAFQACAGSGLQFVERAGMRSRPVQNSTL